MQHLIDAYNNNLEVDNDFKVLETQKKKNEYEKCYLLYEKAKIKNEVNRLMFEKHSELKERQELSECTFKPKLNKNIMQLNNQKQTINDTYKRNITWKLRNEERFVIFSNIG